MKCLILAAGYATRLYPLTENFPKPLLEVQGKTILDWLLEDIDKANMVDEYVVISNHKFAEHFYAWAEKKEMKITPYEYHLKNKIDRAMLLLETSDLSIKEIAFSLGFSDEHYFSDIFKRKTGIKPTHYRKSTQS